MKIIFFQDWFFSARKKNKRTQIYIFRPDLYFMGTSHAPIFLGGQAYWKFIFGLSWISVKAWRGQMMTLIYGDDIYKTYL